MPLVSGYETIKSRAFYHINFQIQNQEFHIINGIEDPQQTLKIIQELKAKGYNPQLNRVICYDSTKSGYLTKKPEYEDLTIEKLEQIILNNEPLPIHRESIIVPNFHGVDIGD
jgi:hypothetical protein